MKRSKKTKHGKLSCSKKKNDNGDDLDEDDNGDQGITPTNMTPTRTGNIAVTKHRNVSYEIRNGQPVFRLRRSPRKSLQNAYLKATHSKKTSANISSSSTCKRTPNKNSSPSLTPSSIRRSSSKVGCSIITYHIHSGWNKAGAQ